MLSRICKHGRLRLGSGASQSVRTLSTLCSKNASCKSRLISWLMTDFSIEIFFVAGRFSMFKSRSSSAAKRMFCSSCAIRSSLSLIKLMSPRFRRRVLPSRHRAKISSKSDWNSPRPPARSSTPSSPLESALAPSGFSPSAAFGSFSSPSWSESVIFGRDFLVCGSPFSSSVSLRIARFFLIVGDPDLLRLLEPRLLPDLERDLDLLRAEPLRREPLLQIIFFLNVLKTREWTLVLPRSGSAT